MSGCPFQFTRRNFLKVAGIAAAAGAGFGLKTATDAISGKTAGAASVNKIEPFRGAHQGGILTPAQSHTYFTSFDLGTDTRDDVIRLLQTWTEASDRMAKGKTAADGGDPPGDTGEALGLPPSRLTLTFGFGPGLFVKDGKDRFGLAKHRPEALVDLPKFPGDQLAPAQTGGDISVQACAEDPQVAFHAVRQLARLADYTAQIRWAQAGFMSGMPGEGTPRNLMGFKDGTGNPALDDNSAVNQFIWADNAGPEWMRGGSYMVARRIRIALEHWDRMKVGFQEQTVGRYKDSGAPLGMKNEFDAVNLDAADKDGNPLLPENSHVRLATAVSNDGMKILRRSYSYNDGVSFTAERWPPWRQGMEYDAGLLFVCYQSDPRTGFIRIFDKLSKFDMMNQFVTHIGGGIFAIPGGAGEGEYIGQKLFAAA